MSPGGGVERGPSQALSSPDPEKPQRNQHVRIKLRNLLLLVKPQQLPEERPGLAATGQDRGYPAGKPRSRSSPCLPGKAQGREATD